MDAFCGSKFWDWNLTWYNETPQFTPCFEKTVLLWTPCSVLCVYAGFAAFADCRSDTKHVPWGWLNISKLVGVGILLLLSCFDLSYIYLWHPKNIIMYAADYTNGLVKFFMFALCGIAIMMNKNEGIRTSATMFCFWFFLTLCSLPHYFREIQNVSSAIESGDTYPYTSSIVYFSLILSMLVLELFVDLHPVFSRYPPEKNLPPSTRTSFISNLLAMWYDSFAIRAYRTPVELKDLWNLEYKDKLEYWIPLFTKYWNVSVNKAKKYNEKLFNKYGNVIYSAYINVAPYNSLPKAKHASIIPALWKCFGWTYISSSILKLLTDIVMLINPQILNLLIGFTESEEPMWKGFFYAFLLLTAGVLQMIFLNTYAFKIFCMGLRMRTTLMAVIYRKALRISSSAKNSYSLGDITNLMSVDAQRFYDVNLYINMAASAPYLILASMYFLWQTIGISALAGLALLLVIIPINAVAASKIRTLQMEQMKCKDERVKITNEVLNGIKVLKMYSWEPSFEKKILEVRSREIRLLKQIAYINTSVSFLWTALPFLVSLVTFAIYVLIDEKNVLTAQIAFVSLSLFNILKLPISLIPRFVTNAIQAAVATNRINKFLNSEELKTSVVTHDKTNDPLIIEKGVFMWGSDKEKATLKDINIRVKNGNLVAIVGPVGSGKSSLLSAFLGEMNKLSGYVNTTGKIAYVPQQAWIQNATLKDNILFTKPYTKSVYHKVVESCALLPDFKVLPGGDMIEIGEKGVNLSGGQKQRISLARAVYNNADNYLLDDPLSAVDAHVGKHIFENVIGPKGLLRKKTRVLVTNSITYLPEVDFIIVMKNGVITESGNYGELILRQGDFADFITNYSAEEGAKAEDTINTDISLVHSDPIETIKNSYERSLSEEINYSNLANFVSNKVDEDLPHLSSIGERLTEDELVREGKIKLSVYMAYIKAGGIFLWSGAILFNVMYQVATIAANLVLTDWSTDPETVSNSSTNTPKTYFYLEIYGLYGVIQIITIIIATLTMFLATTDAGANLHNNLLKKILKWPSYMFDVTPTSRIINRFSYDIDVLDNTLPITLRQLFLFMGQMLSVVYVVSYSSPYFLILFMPITIVYIVLEQIYVAVMRQLKRLESISRTPIYSHFSETVSGAHVIRAYSMENTFIEESEKRMYLNQVYTYPSLEGQRWISLRLDNIANVIILFAALFAVFGRGVINSGIIGLSVTYALQITGALNWVIRTASDTETCIVAVERIKEFDNTVEEKVLSADYKNVNSAWPTRGEIIFDNFKVRYREGLDLVLRGISIKINAGEKVGIAGRTGAGKSSLTSCLFRIIEAAEGKIIIDGIDISTIELQTLRSRITIIPQDPVIFSGTLRMNLDPFYEYSDQNLWRALELAHLKTYVLSLPRGLYYVISEDGGNLSIGQRQLVCLARALLRKTKILVLDEATAAIDLETDELLQKTIRREFKHCTILTIAHKLNTIMDSDRILVLDNGYVKEFDSPQNLLKSKNSVFYAMAKDAELIM